MYNSLISWGKRWRKVPVGRVRWLEEYGSRLFSSSLFEQWLHQSVNERCDGESHLCQIFSHSKKQCRKQKIGAGIKPGIVGPGILSLLYSCSLLLSLSSGLHSPAPKQKKQILVLLYIYAIKETREYCATLESLMYLNAIQRSCKGVIKIKFIPVLHVSSLWILQQHLHKDASLWKNKKAKPRSH